MKEEHSAGGLIIKKATDHWNILLLKDMNSNWTFPKGFIEEGEDALTAAKREILEEAGVDGLALRSPLTQITYWYVREGEKIHKTVDYFLFEVFQDQPLTPQKEEGISDVRWVDIQESLKIIGYPKTNIPLIQQVIQSIQ